ncbi:PHP domain-containing protein [Candidatus Woesearchaeota archaeon]|nr:MAG: PHP domain-containing protein [Candidatus Woesearchaeota archaeon]
MKIVNPIAYEDYHMHTSTFSDGIPTLNELVIYAGKIGLKKIAITDHCQASADFYKYNMAPRVLVDRWSNVHNDVEVIFGIEGDILDDNGNMSKDLQGIHGKVLIASLHPETYTGTNPTKAYIEAMKNNTISFIGHPCAKYFASNVDVIELTRAANDLNIPLEVNGASLMNNRTNLAKLDTLLEHANRIIINSDAHTLYELKKVREFALDYLFHHGFI